MDVKGNACLAPHVVVLGAGATLAAFPNGDRNGKRLPLMRNLVEVLGLEPTLKKYGFKTTVPDFELFYDDLVMSGRNPLLMEEIERSIHDYFADLKLPAEATLYDYLLLSLREKDLIATFNWDPFLAQAYRRNPHLVKLPRVVFLHGNVDVGVCRDHFQKGWLHQSCPVCKRQFEPSRLLHPVRQKDYNTDGFIKNEWEVLREFLTDAYFVTVFGYSVPATDVEAKKLMLERWRDNPIRWLAEIEIVDLKSRGELEATWREFLDTPDKKHQHSIAQDIFDTQAFRYPRRSCDAIAMANLQQAPFSENAFPRVPDLRELHDWLKPLIKEEDDNCFSGKRTKMNPIH